MKSRFLILILGSLLTSVGYSDGQANIDSSNKTTYLKKPTGQSIEQLEAELAKDFKKEVK